MLDANDLARSIASLDRDPYWPKWDTPWWHMTLAWEMGEASRIPPEPARKMVEVLNRHYIRIFPVRAEEVPPGIDPVRNIPCHCALGTMIQVLDACGVDTDAELPWVRPWFLRYQLPDGGLNCDEAAYTREVPRSSIVSTLPCLEAILRNPRRTLLPEEIAFVDRGARYLIERRLYLSLSKGKPMHPDFARLCFPRFYEYDVLRGLSFLLEWSRKLDRELPTAAIADAHEIVETHRLSDGMLAPSRRCYDGEGSYSPQEDGKWTRVPRASLFALLEEVSEPGKSSPGLTRLARVAGTYLPC